MVARGCLRAAGALEMATALDMIARAYPGAARALDTAVRTLSCAKQAWRRRSKWRSKLLFEGSARSHDTLFHYTLFRIARVWICTGSHYKSRRFRECAMSCDSRGGTWHGIGPIRIVLKQFEWDEMCPSWMGACRTGLEKGNIKP